MQRLIPILLLTLSTNVVADDTIPGELPGGPVVLENATFHPVSGPPIRTGRMVFKDGIITAIGRNVQAPRGAQVVDCAGLNVYPGMIEAHSQIGLMEFAAVRASRDHSESGEMNPNVKAHVSVNPDSTIIPVTRSNGVLLAVTAPSGGLISGQAAVLQLDGWTYEDMTLQPAVGMMVNWPRMQVSAFSSDSASEFREHRDEHLQELRDLIEDAKAYQTAREVEGSSQRYDIRLEALQPMISGKQPMIVAANDARQIQAAVAFSVEYGLKMIVFGGYDAVACADLLKRHDIPVIVSAVHRMPRRRYEDYDAAYTLPVRLKEAGIRFCISGSDRSETWNARNLPYQAGTAIAWGLSRDDALRSVTLSAAEILGVDDRVGSLEVGKHATFFVATGNPLETSTRITSAWIGGRPVDLADKHKRLYRKYKEKYRQADAQK